MKLRLPYLFAIVVLLLQGSLSAQINFTESNLPIVIITTDINPGTGQPTEIPDEPKVSASMKIIFHNDGTTNYVSDQNNDDYLDYDGRIKIEIRGSTSQNLPKKQYGWTTYEDNDDDKLNVSLLGMPKENDWILNGLAFDPSLIRDYLAYNLSRQMGYYTTRTQFCEVIINGEYKGLYILQEKLKDDSNRINIEEIDEDASSGIALTGGYITKADKTTGGDPVAWTMESNVGETEFIHELPKPEDVTPQQDTYIHNQFLMLESTSATGNTDAVTGYPSVIDIPTFVDFMVMNEIASNSDAYQISTFFHKDLGGKLRAGPIWDFNLTFGNDLFIYGLDRSHTDVWQFTNDDNEGPRFWTDLFNNAEYKCYFSRRWHEVTADGQPLNYNSIETFIDNTVALISDAVVREQQTWGTVPNHAQEIANLKVWVADRIDWINANIGSYTACENIDVPSLTITAIHYHPDESDEFPESDDQEFIAITNTGNAAVDLTGIYLRELGVSYRFPANETLAASQTLYLANNTAVFEAKHGLTAFGEFQRNLSNSTQNIVLADSFGNIIDAVAYDDDAPWPDADGSGDYLQLISTDLDNALASSWTAISDSNLSAPGHQISHVIVYPNPVNNVLNIKADGALKKIEVYNIEGRQLLVQQGTAENINMTSFSPGIYFVKVTLPEGTMQNFKILKQ